MASTTVETLLPSGLSGLLLKLFDRGADTLLNPTGGGDALTERTNSKGVYQATVTEAISGNKRAIVYLSDGITPIFLGRVYMLDDTSTYFVVDEDGSTAAGNLPAEVESMEAGVITSAAFAAGAINAAAVATDALGALELGADAVAEIAAAIEAGGINLTITPIQATTTNPRYSTRDLPPIAEGSEPTEIFVITDAAGAAVNLSGKTLRFVVVTVDEDEDTEAVFDDTISSSFKYETGGGGITIGGASSNQVTVVHDDAKTGVPGEYRYFLWNTTDKLLLVKGSLKIEPALIDVT